MYIYNESKTQIMYIPEGSTSSIHFSISSMRDPLAVIPATIYLKIDGDIYLSVLTENIIAKSNLNAEDLRKHIVRKIQYGVRHIIQLLKNGDHEDTNIWIRDTCDFEVCDDCDKLFSDEEGNINA